MLAVDPKSAATAAASALLAARLELLERETGVETRWLELRLVAREIPDDPPPEEPPLSSPLMDMAETLGPEALELPALLELLELLEAVSVEVALLLEPPLRREL